MLIFALSLITMSFLYPNILWGLMAVSIPVIIHLFNFRKFRKIYFTNVRFLEELKQQTRKQSKLRHLLVMIARMLAIACPGPGFCTALHSNSEECSQAGCCQPGQCLH